MNRRQFNKDKRYRTEHLKPIGNGILLLTLRFVVGMLFINVIQLAEAGEIV